MLPTEHLLTHRRRFQWAALQIEELLILDREQDIRAALGSLPETLEKAYEAIFASVDAQKGTKPLVAARAFQWVMCSEVPVTRAELVAAVCVDANGTEEAIIDIDTDFVLDACRNLLVLDSKLNVWRFSHLSVQEFVEQSRWKATDAHALVAKTCLRVMARPAWKYAIAVEREKHCFTIEAAQGHEDRFSVLFNYAALRWPFHVQLHTTGPVDESLTSLLSGFLAMSNEDNTPYSRWHRLLKTLRLPSIPVKAVEGDHADSLAKISAKDMHTLLDPPTAPALAMCVFGFTDLLSRHLIIKSSTRPSWTVPDVHFSTFQHTMAKKPWYGC